MGVSLASISGDIQTVPNLVCSEHIQRYRGPFCADVSVTGSLIFEFAGVDLRTMNSAALSHWLGGFPISKYPPNVLVDGIRAYWVPDEWAQARNPKPFSIQSINPP